MQESGLVSVVRGIGGCTVCLLAWLCCGLHGAPVRPSVTCTAPDVRVGSVARITCQFQHHSPVTGFRLERGRRTQPGNPEVVACNLQPGLQTLCTRDADVSRLQYVTNATSNALTAVTVTLNVSAIPAHAGHYHCVMLTSSQDLAVPQPCFLSVLENSYTNTSAANTSANCTTGVSGNQMKEANDCRSFWISLVVILIVIVIVVLGISAYCFHKRRSQQQSVPNNAEMKLDETQPFIEYASNNHRTCPAPGPRRNQEDKRLDVRLIVEFPKENPEVKNNDLKPYVVNKDQSEILETHDEELDKENGLHVSDEIPPKIPSYITCNKAV